MLVKNQQAEELAFKTLIADALRWKELKVLDEYLSELLSKQTHNPAFLEWLNWAKQKRISEDPLLNFMRLPGLFNLSGAKLYGNL